MAKFEVKIEEIVAGWINFDIICNEKVFVTCFSECFDPTGCFFEWLEKIINDDYFPVLEYDQEGYYTNILFDKIDNVSARIKIYSGLREYLTNVYGDLEDFALPDNLLPSLGYDEEMKDLIIDEMVDIKEFIGAYYIEFLSYAYSDKYEPIEWEEVPDNPKSNWRGFPLKQLKSKIIEEYLGIDESSYANTSK